MQRTLITPDSEAEWLQLRTEDVTSTEVSALFGMSPYSTRLQLWERKRSGLREELEPNERIVWGRRLEHSIAAGVCEDNGWAARPFKEYGRVLGIGIGGSFDWRILANGPLSGDSADDVLLEVKNVDGLAFARGWVMDGDMLEAPAHIELQVQHQLLVSGLRRAVIAAFVGGNRVVLLEREADDQVHAAIIAQVAEFWASVREGREPAPQMPRDAETLIARLQYAEPGKLLDARGDARIASLVASYAELGRQASEIEDARKVLKAELLQAIGDSEKVLLDGYSVSAGMVGPSTYVVEKQGYRNLRVTAKKAKVAA